MAGTTPASRAAVGPELIRPEARQEVEDLPAGRQWRACLDLRLGAAEGEAKQGGGPGGGDVGRDLPLPDVALQILEIERARGH